MFRQDAFDVSGAGLLAFFVAADGAVGVPVRPTAVALRDTHCARAQASQAVHAFVCVQGFALPTSGRLRITVFQLANQLKFPGKHALSTKDSWIQNEAWRILTH